MRQEDNVKKGSKSAKHRKPIVSLTEMSVIPEKDRVFKDCIHEYAVVFILIYVDNTAVEVTVRHWSDVFMRKSELMEVLISISLAISLGFWVSDILMMNLQVRFLVIKRRT